MALNPTTGIDYEVDRFVIRLVSTNQIINTNAQWPRLDGAAVSGANPDRAYFKKVAGDRPDADHRFSVTETFSCVPFDPAVDPADGLPVGEYKPEYSALPLPIEDLKRQIDDQFRLEFNKHFPATSDPVLLIEAGKSLVLKTDGATLTPEQQEKYDTLHSIGTATGHLRERQAALYAAAEAFVADPESDAGIYDIEAGWELI